MVMTTDITIRDVLRNHQAVFEKVRRTKKPAIVFNRTKPEVAIIDLETLALIREIKKRKENSAILNLIGIIPKGTLPKDTAQNHTDYAWS